MDPRPTHTTFLSGGGEMGARMRAFDWATSTMGPPDAWPQSLRTTLTILLNTNHPMFIWWGPDLIQFYNDAYMQTMGPERHPSALGQRGRECWEEIWPIIGPQIEQVMSGQGPTWHEDQLVPVTRHGSLENVWWTYGYSPIVDEAGDVGGVLVVCNDVTVQHETTETLRKTDERLQFALDAGGGVGTWDWDIASDRIYADARFATLFSVDPVRAAQGTPVDEFVKAIHPDDRDRIARRIKEAVAKGADFAEEYRVVGSGGRVRWLIARGRCYHDEAGRAVRFPGVVVDNSERQLALQALQDANLRKDEFLAMLGHELRNPLAPILTSLEVLERVRFDSPKVVRDALGIIGRQTRHLAELIDELLDVARITTGKITLNLDHVEIASAVHRAVEQSQHLISSRRHRLDLELPDEPLYLKGDLGRITQVISNLLNNAAKYTEPGGTITLAVAADDRDVRIRVSDTGIGIPAETLPHVFDLFTQSRRALDRSQGGLGIGLTLVRRIVELHGGRVSARSAGAGCGSEFLVRLPRIEATVVPQPADGPGDRTAHPVVRRKILVVDDNKDAADMLNVALTMDGHDVRTVGDGLRVVAEARAFRPDIVLLDLGLPGLSGFEIAKTLKTARDTTAIVLIALTGYGQQEDRLQTRAAGFDDHLVKPVDLDSLRNAIERVAPSTT